MLSVFCSPGRYTQGRGATTALGREMAALGLEGPALVIASKTVIARLAGMWKSSLDEAGIVHVVHTFGGECSPVEIENIKSTARRCTALSIIGAGGGKVVDGRDTPGRDKMRDGVGGNRRQEIWPGRSLTWLGIRDLSTCAAARRRAITFPETGEASAGPSGPQAAPALGGSCLDNVTEKISEQLGSEGPPSW